MRLHILTSSRSFEMKHDKSLSVPVRVSLPASVASEIGSLKKAVGTVLGKLGCPACCSGFDIFLDLQRDFVLHEGPKSAAIAVSSGRAGMSKLRKERLRVGLHPDFASSIENVYSAIDKIADLSGHTACATGCDMFFELERSLVLDAKFNVEEMMMTVG
jgi:hypothetical protein